MSRLAAPSSQPGWSSRTSFAALEIESGEESEEELSVDEPATSPADGSEPAKLTKSALKKQKALARQEKRLQEKAARAAARARSAQVSPAPEQQQATNASVPEKPKPTPEAEVAKSNDASDVVEDAPPPAQEPTERKPQSNGHVLVSVQDVVPPVLAAQPVPPLPAPSPDPTEATQPPPVPQPEVRREHVDVPARQKEALPSVPSAQESESAKKRQNALTRTLWTFIMIGGFLTLLLMGHVYMIILVMLCSTLVYREVTALFSLKSKDSDTPQTRGRDPWSKTLNWYFFAVANYYLYGESIIYYFKHVVFSDAQLTIFATNHRIISFALYTIGFVGFVMSLKRGYLKQQFGLFCWVHMTLLLIVVSSHFIVNNILEGMIWFWVPASLVICNDVFAYIWGITIGRTPLIKLSPKKTVEGFVGAFFSTVVFGVVWGTYFMQFQYMICPVNDLGVSAFDSGHCEPNPVFLWRDWTMPAPLGVLLSTVLGRTVTTIPYAPYQLHLLTMSCFASLVAPFGGFFASGFKRAFDIKDFGQSIPGHGGMTDRMDCQFLMGVFTYVYYSSLIREVHVTVGSVLQTIVSGLTVTQQLELMADLKRYLEGQGIAVNI
ncbi:phosphatidate cytidylyltransferase [Cristinia sonorae]|uniref:Phosphatidate cytidylyltransferase n=1 Tax=Cristinia sonorae TaxID=1940300 RepID=A0A8K0XV40_9AGAR|nr:phosphatidate cytidylyltransferase [Cristinia sonorae]